MNRNQVVLYVDGTWESVLTAAFDVFAHKFFPLDLRLLSNGQSDLFAATHHVVSDAKKADRVRKGLTVRDRNVYNDLWWVYLSELPGSLLLILRAIMYYFDSVQPVNTNYQDPRILQISNIVRSVSREKHRMKAFVRFRRLEDGVYFALIAPDFNVLPLIYRHFADRYADQQWLIYDQKRNYGIYYDLKDVSEVYFSAAEPFKPHAVEQHDATEEQTYDSLWKVYFSAVNIEERKNMKLHIRHVPRRYWRFLNEKTPRT